MSMPHTFDPDETVEINLRLQSTSRIRGTVFLPDGVTPVGENVVLNYKSEEFKVFCTENKFGDETCINIPQGIQSVNTAISASVSDMSQIAGEVAANVNTAVSTLQFQDVASQLLGHTRPRRW